MKCPIMMKTALNAQKARSLAKSVGLIPHEKSQWRWALKQMRKANPSGVKGAPLMMKGKELAKAKERMGKLPNNERQIMSSLSRKQRQGVEIGKTVKNKYRRGNVGFVSGDDLKAHTHPRFNRISNMDKAKRKIDPRYKEIANRTMYASPSGALYDYNRGSYEKHLMRGKSYDNAVKRLEKIKQNNPKDLKYYLSKKRRNSVKKIDRRIIKTKNNGRYNELMTGRGDSDAAGIRDYGKTHNILAPGVEGVHKSRLKLPRAIRSVYFKGGLD